MTVSRNLWSLPSATDFLSALEDEHDSGLTIVRSDPAMPPRWTEEFRDRLMARHQEVHEVRPQGRDTPAAALAAPLHCAANLKAFIGPAHQSLTLIVDLADLGKAELAQWWIFLSRFRRERQLAGTGVSLVIEGIRPAETLPPDLASLSWNDRWRRLDVTIWVDMHSVDERTEPLASLASALAIELCGWRVDLAAEFVRASRDDLLDPLSWISRHEDDAVEGSRGFGGAPFVCPLAAYRAGNRTELIRRIWRGHLSALFPWIEDLRQELVERHRKVLRITEAMDEQGIKDVLDIELGALAHQLRPHVGREEKTRLECLARIRNAIAHRRPAEPVDLVVVLRSSASRR